MAAAYAAAVLAFAYAAVSPYWAAGGTALLSTVGGNIEDIGRNRGVPAVALGLGAAALKLGGAILALALVRPSGRAMPHAWLLACATAASTVLARKPEKETPMDLQQLRASHAAVIAADPHDLYNMVSDITRTGQWSPACTGGQWDEGGGRGV
jgi:hypothetical protein